MAEITKPATVSYTSFDPAPDKLQAFPVAGENIVAGDNCYVQNDGTVWRATGAAANAAAQVRGQAAKAASAGFPVTLCKGLRFGGYSGLTPGADYYLSGTVPGGLADAPSTGGTAPVAWAVNATTVEFFHAN